MKFKHLLPVLLGWFLAGGIVFATPSPEARATVVVYNKADPASAALAKYYASRRDIPDDHVIGLSCPLTEEISRQEFDATIVKPFRDTCVRKGWWRLQDGRVTQTKIRFVALIRGLPLKIRSEGEKVQPRPDQQASIGQRDEASVDSELACLGLGTPVAGIIQNPYYRRFTPVLEAITDPGLLLVCRLDALSEITVRAMIDDALMAERSGLWGWAYVDSRGIKDGGYAEGDKWLSTAADDMREKGIPVLWDKAPETFPTGYPVTDAAVYLGWYANSICGPFADPAFRFRPGAIAVHIHSFSASTLRDPLGGWCGPLLERGAAVTLGNVYEPYLTATANLDIFQDRLMAGFTFAESAYMSVRALSWMGVAIGDPLYRPYANWRELSDSAKPSNWELYRKIILATDGKIPSAASRLSEAAAQTGDSMFLESLAAAQADSGDLNLALITVNKALTMPGKPLVRFRLVLEKFGLLQAMGKKSDAGALILAEQGRNPAPAQAELLGAIARRLFPPPPTATPTPAIK